MAGSGPDRQRTVGTLVVLNKWKQPIGIVTDRDMMERVVAENLDGSKTAVKRS